LWLISEDVIQQDHSQKMSCGFKSGLFGGHECPHHALQEICANLHGHEMSHEESSRQSWQCGVSPHPA
jgi:hypothetical protein